jgi:hypothetical protein
VFAIMSLLMARRRYSRSDSVLYTPQLEIKGEP